VIALVEDSSALIGRQMRHIARVPESLLGVTLLPIAIVLIFGYMLGSVVQPGASPYDYREYIMAGIFIQVMVSGMVTTATGFSDDLKNGLVDRFRSLPMSRASVLIGRTVSDLVLAAISCVVVAVVGYLIGWRAHEGVAKTAAGFGLLLLLGFVMAWLGALIAMAARSAEAVSGLSFLVMPIAFLSNAFVPLDNLPHWLRVVAEWNPVSTVALACRQLFGNPGADATSGAYPAQHPVPAALVILLGLLAILVPLAVRSYRRAVAR
jgi:ABC transporter DrrB family efflux protein